MITPEIKLRTFLICWFVPKENTGKQMLIKRWMYFFMNYTLTTPSIFGEKNKGLSNKFLVNIALFKGLWQYEFDLNLWIFSEYSYGCLDRNIIHKNVLYSRPDLGISEGFLSPRNITLLMVQCVKGLSKITHQINQIVGRLRVGAYSNLMSSLLDIKSFIKYTSREVSMSLGVAYPNLGMNLP